MKITKISFFQFISALFISILVFSVEEVQAFPTIEQSCPQEGVSQSYEFIAFENFGIRFKYWSTPNLESTQ